MNPERTLEVLTTLERLGLDDEIFATICPHPDEPGPGGLSRFRCYCRDAVATGRQFRRDGRNQRLYRRLAFVLGSYRARELPRGDKAALAAFARTAAGIIKLPHEEPLVPAEFFDAR